MERKTLKQTKTNQIENHKFFGSKIHHKIDLHQEKTCFAPREKFILPIVVANVHLNYIKPLIQPSSYSPLYVWIR